MYLFYEGRANVPIAGSVNRVFKIFVFFLAHELELFGTLQRVQTSTPDVLAVTADEPHVFQSLEHIHQNVHLLGAQLFGEEQRARLYAQELQLALPSEPRIGERAMHVSEALYHVLRQRWRVQDGSHHVDLEQCLLVLGREWLAHRHDDLLCIHRLVKSVIKVRLSFEYSTRFGR